MAQPTNSHRSFHSLTTSDMKLLTRILSHQPSPIHPYDSSTQAKYRELTKKDIDKLPVHLKKESGQGKSLCKMHAGLNAGYIDSIFEWIHKQVDVSLPKSLAGPTDAEVAISDAVVEPFLHLLEIQSMWTTSPSSFFVRRQSKQGKRWALQQDGCKACMLARLGGEEDIITPLRASVVAKLSAGDKPKSRRLVWLAALIYGCFTEEAFQRIIDKSEILGRSLRTANTEAAYKKAKHAECWSSTAMSPEAGHTKATARKAKTIDRGGREAEHVADVTKEVGSTTDEVTRSDQLAQQEVENWQAQQLQARRKERQRSVTPIDDIEPHLPPTLDDLFVPSSTSITSTTPLASNPPLAFPFATPSPPPLRPTTSHTGTPPPFLTHDTCLAEPEAPLNRPRTSHALPKYSWEARVPSFLRRKTSKSSLNEHSTAPPPPLSPPLPLSSSPTLMDTPRFPSVPRNSASASSGTPPSPPPKDMSADLLQRIDSLYNAYHPAQSPPPLPPKESHSKHTLLARLNTKMQDPPDQRHLIPIPQPKRSSSIYSQNTHSKSLPHLSGQASSPILRKGIYENTKATGDGIHRSMIRRHHNKQRNSHDSTSTTTPTDHAWESFPHITSLPAPTPDSIGEYRRLISEQETKFLAPTPPPPRHLKHERGRGTIRSKSSLDNVEELNESLEEKQDKLVRRRLESHVKFRPLSPSHMRRQFDVRLSPQGAGAQGSTGGFAMNSGRTGGFEAQNKEFGRMRTRFRPTASPVDGGEYQMMDERQKNEMGVDGNGVEKESMDSSKTLYDKLREQVKRN
ncbi:hypothetical protein FKW77_000254 [Venturia effusa]|uniref:Uncharacterized protein n=1 Tax=Venturia effusa TaxID=50376 RepID=A0A517LPB4_9PEZI|nr:hypothetical protein FKW77_000254 [Venturia effusa]